MQKLQEAEEQEEEGSCFQKPFFNDTKERLASRLRCSQKAVNEPRLGIAQISSPKRLQPNFSNEALRQPKALQQEGTCSKKALLARFEVWDHFAKFDPFSKNRHLNSQDFQPALRRQSSVHEH